MQNGHESTISSVVLCGTVGLVERLAVGPYVFLFPCVVGPKGRPPEHEVAMLVAHKVSLISPRL